MSRSENASIQFIPTTPQLERNPSVIPHSIRNRSHFFLRIHKEEELILARQGLADLGEEIDMMEKYIYDAREKDVSREVDIFGC